MTKDDAVDPAPSHPQDADAGRPVDLHLDKKEGLRIDWADGHASRYSLAYLRKHCPCATCKAEPPETNTEVRSTSLTVLPANINRAAEFVDAKLVGNYALRIDWADGHNTGIYDFRYLRAICPSAGKTGEKPE